MVCSDLATAFTVMLFSAMTNSSNFHDNLADRPLARCHVEQKANR